MADGKTLVLTDGDFETTVLGAELPVLVDFWADWCTPCKMIAPAVEQIAREQTGKLTVGKLDVDKNPDTAFRYGVQSIPTLILFKKGQEAERIVGSMPKERLEAKILAHL